MWRTGELEEAPFSSASSRLSHSSTGTFVPGALLQSATSATITVMSRTITQRELRNDSAAVLRDVQAGETVIVTRNGTPIAELKPVPPRRFVPRAAIASAAQRAPRVDLIRLRADLDAVVNPLAHD